MATLKRTLFWVSFYLAVIFILGQTDYVSSPIVDFASYFYIMVMAAVPATLFFPYVSRVSVYIPLMVWAGIYMVILQTINRSGSTVTGEFSVIVLEILLLEAGVWIAYQLAGQISQAESLMDALALTAFPNSVRDIDAEEKRIKIELTRSRRYHRPLGLVVIESESDDETIAREMVKSIQHDLMFRFTSARIGQIIDDRIRQTDLVLRDHHGRFVVFCPETDFESATLLAQRIGRAVEERTSHHILCGVAAFPEDALTFDDLLQKARSRTNRITSMSVDEDESIVSAR